MQVEKNSTPRRNEVERISICASIFYGLLKLLLLLTFHETNERV